MKQLKRFLKRSIIAKLALLFCVFIFRGSLYRHLFSYKTIGHRKNYKAFDKELTDYIDTKTPFSKQADIKDIILFSLNLTSETLTFSIAKNENNPNKLFRTKKAHCVGYASFFSSTCNYMIDKFGHANKWSSEPLIGQIYFCGINIHQFLKSSFFKDHDFNCITNKLTGEKYFVDPSINDYLSIDYVTAK